ncbi:hypothetical protein [Agromyces silvae]|uniref:hypothetical protein n=1 Tax=Agromyces silvae TaxID=3388266 RepID=UPI00280B75D5|nr:hypothetical protein [Agromyces protaetiae]
MHSEIAAVVGPDRSTAGAPSLAQGAYGVRGNLELLACDRTDGLWVFWFNADLVTDPLETPDVPPGAWSAGLSFASGHRYLDAQIVQSSLGPDHLEVLALDERGALQSWYWSPGLGFQRRAADAATDVSRFTLTHVAGSLDAIVVGRDGGARRLVSDADAPGYPDRTWNTSPAGETDTRSTREDPRVRALIVAAGEVEAQIAPGTARSARSTRNGGTTELTWRDTAGRIRHLGR